MDVNYRRGNGGRETGTIGIGAMAGSLYARGFIIYRPSLDFGPSFPVQQARTVRHGSPITRPIGAKIRAAAFLISPATFVKKSFSLGVFHAQSERSSLANRSVALESLPLSILTSGSQITATPPRSAHRIKPEYMR